MAVTQLARHSARQITGNSLHNERPRVPHLFTRVIIGLDKGMYLERFSSVNTQSAQTKKYERKKKGIIWAEACNDDLDAP